MPPRWGQSADGVEELLAVALVDEGFADDFTGEDATFPTLAGHSQGIAHVADRTRPVFHRGADLRVGDTLAETNVHGVPRTSFLMQLNLIGMRMIVNKNIFSLRFVHAQNTKSALSLQFPGNALQYEPVQV